ncbi:hypothetical protein BJ508DRAFT_83774 [Ascobolus immersus RN42]|uniref:Uncharacterized protein n=1 Tax=Ascobolus immersus RN42 TaxID=1160509 RepID=A0A3N4IBC8_ASCIM|nr:hypothetical protein BJ508DRAFT_83774 [Ascobolus immersus RN42]
MSSRASPVHQCLHTILAFHHLRSLPPNSPLDPHKRLLTIPINLRSHPEPYHFNEQEIVPQSATGVFPLPRVLNEGLSASFLYIIRWLSSSVRRMATAILYQYRGKSYRFLQVRSVQFRRVCRTWHKKAGSTSNDKTDRP